MRTVRKNQVKFRNLTFSYLSPQTILNVRIVYSIGYESVMMKKYSEDLKRPMKSFVKRTIVAGLFYGLGHAAMFVIIAIVLHAGSIFIKNYGVDTKDVFTVVFALFYVSMAMGNVSNILPNINSCKDSAQQVLKIMDAKDEEQIQVDENSKMIKDKKIEGSIVLKNIKYKYENRSDYLFNNLNMQIPYGCKVAFVGSSGCGKSTVLSFLLRFYQPESGQILLDGVNIKDFDIHFLRSQFGVVSQEPVLFNTSFKDNIKYNLQVPNEQILSVAKQAHALNFILSSQQKDNYNPAQSVHQIIKVDLVDQSPSTWKAFDRTVGPKGSHISGGQKQRIAIARAILRKPQTLLLDQATSALDDQSQIKVQSCLDQIMINKSSISVTHRYNTIKNSKIIFVFQYGQIVESGTYQQLMEKKKYFYVLQK